MKKSAVLILLFFFVCATADAQRQKIDSLQNIVNGLPDTAKMAAYYSLGLGYVNISSDSSAMYASMSLELAQKYSSKMLEAKNYSLLGVSEKNKGNYEKAITYHLKSLKTYEAENDERGMAIGYNDIGILYKSMHRIDEALSYYKKSNELCKKLKLASGISMTYNNIGTIMKERSMKDAGYLDSAIYYYDLALGEAQKKGNPYDISTCLSNIGEVYIDLKKYDTALSIYQQCLVYDKGNEDKYGMCMTYLHLGSVYLLLNSLGNADKYADSAYKIATDEPLLLQKLDVIEVKSKIKAAQHDFVAALKLKDDYINLKDSIINEETSKQISELQTKYETARKEKELSKKELLIQKRNYEIAGIIGGMALLSVLVFFLYNRQQIKQKQAREKAVQNAEFNERLRIAKDVHDDLGSGLSKISLTANAAERKALTSGNPAPDMHHIASLSKDLADNMRDLIWVLNPDNTTLDNLLAHIREYCTDYLDGMGIEPELSFPADVPDMRISRETQRNIFLTIKEAINNCVKHAHATSISITLAINENTLSLAIADNGKGIDLKNLKGGGNGLRNMKQRIEAIGGNFSMDPSGMAGTTILIVVPVNKLRAAGV